MKISKLYCISFKRRLKDSEKAEYSDVLEKAKKKAAKGDCRTILIIPPQSLPQAIQNNTGVGNIASEEGQKFFEFAKQYWGINEVQLLPTGHYYGKQGRYFPYSGSSIDFGNHIINLKDFLSAEEFKKVVDRNIQLMRSFAIAQDDAIHFVNYSNVIELDSISEDALLYLYKNIKPELKREFEAYKAENNEMLEKKSLYRALREVHKSHDYHKWGNLDSNLFNEDIISASERETRIKEIKIQKAESIDFYKFKNFLAEKSMAKAKYELNNKGIKLNGDMIYGFAYEEEWAEPKAFLKDYKIKEWGFRFYAKRFDGIRIDASWAYISPNICSKKDKNIESKLYYGEKFLDIIDDEIKKVKGDDFNLDNIMHEFSADYRTQFDIHNFDGKLKPYVKNRVKIYTSEHLSNTWGSAKNFIERGWDNDKFIIGVMNHDSPPMENNEEQINALNRILGIPKKKLYKTTEFIKAKFAETMRAKNTMLFFLPALGINTKYQHNKNKTLDWTAKVPENYEDIYIKSLSEGNGFNPMDALEKQFKAQGLDKKEPKLYKKIVKYKKILEKKENTALYTKIIIGAVSVGIVLLGLYKYMDYKNHSSSK